MQAMDVGLPIVGLASERHRLLDALRKGDSVVLLGPLGCGKTTTIRFALEAAGSGSLYIPYRAVLHDLLAALARALQESRHPVFLRLSGADWKDGRWAATQTSIRLRGLLWSALEAQPRTIILDGVEGAGHRTFRFLQRLSHSHEMVIIAAARDFRGLGTLTRLFWDPRKMIQFQPLSQNEAVQLFELAVKRFGLQGLALEDFRLQVLESARGNPGQIVEMCRMATDARYVTGRYIKFVPLRIDAMVKFMS